MFFDLKNCKNRVNSKEFKKKKKIVDNLVSEKKYKEKLHDFSFLFQDNKLLKKKIIECTGLFSGYKKIIVIGTGGSSLGSKALLEADSNNKIIFLENIDPKYLLLKLNKIKESKILLLIISKSGETTEVLSLYSVIVNHLSKYFKKKNNIIIISDKKESPLLELSKKYKIKFIEHNSKIGGRYSCFSETGLIPLNLAGLNSMNIKKLSDKVLSECFNNKYFFSENIAVLSTLIGKKKYFGHVVLSYQESLHSMILWYRQLWGESLGKNGKGVHFLQATGSIDQHSQLQMWLDGPDNIFYTIIIPKKRRNNFKVKDNNKLLPSYLHNQTLGEILYSMGIATYNELVKAKRPVRLIFLEDDSLYPSVKLMSFLMLEVAILGRILGINPFNQPAVEKVKILTKKLLTKNG